MHVDVDRLHQVNFEHGQAVGDRVLTVLADRLRGVLPGDATVTSPLGGELMVVLAHASIERARALSDLVAMAVSRPIDVDGETISVTVCVGLASDDRIGAEDDLIERAFIACRRAKSIGPGTVVSYDDSVEVEEERRRRRAGELRRAITEGQLRVVVQPEVDLRDGQVVGVEALVRWMHPVDGLLLPASFLPDIEALGLMGELGNWVLEESIDLASRWRGIRGGSPMRVWVNLAAQQLMDGERVVSRIRSALAVGLITPQCIGFEVTESSLLEDLPSAVAMLAGLRSLGIEIALDDFGTGYSSLTYLRQLPVTAVKIDRQFVSGIGGSLADEAIVEAVIDLSHALGLRVVAEGIEDVARAEALVRLGADHAQGYYFGQPMSPAELEARLTLPWCGATPPHAPRSIIDRRADELPGFGSPRARLLLAAFDSAHDAVVVTSARPGPLGPPIVYVNAAFEEETGFSAMEVVGMPVTSLLADPDDRVAAAWFADARRDCVGSTLEMTTRRADGSVYICETTISPITDERGVHTHWLHVRRDMSQRRAAEGDRARFQGLIEQTTSFVYLADATGTLLYMNAALRTALGVDPDVPAESMSTQLLFTSEQNERIACEVAPALREHRRWSGEGTLLNRVTGATTEVVSDVQVVDDPLHPGVFLLASVSRDVSEVNALARAQRRRRELAAFASLVASEALDVGHDEFFAHIDRLLGMFGVLLDVDRVYLDRIDGAESLIRPLGGWASERYPSTLEPEAVAFARVPRWLERLDAGGVVNGSSASAPAAWVAELASAYPGKPPGTNLTAALRVGGELVGALGLASMDLGRVWHDDEIAAVQSVADTFANLLARRRADLAVQTSEARLSAMLANVGELLLVIDAEGVIRYANSRVHAILGFEAGAVIGRPFYVLVEPDDVEAAVDAFRRTTIGDVLPSFEVRLRSADGRTVWFDVESQGLLDPVVGGYTVTLRDVSLRHDEQLRAQRQAGFEEVLSRVSRWALAVDAQALDSELGVHLEALGRVLGADSVHVTLFDDDRVRDLGAWVADHAPPGATQLPHSVVHLVERCRDLSTLVVCDIRDHAGAWVDEWLSFAVPDRAGVDVPLVSGGRCFGNLGVAMISDPRQWRDDEIAVIERMSETLSTLLASVVAETMLRESETRLAALLDGSHDLLVVVDHEGTITYANGSVERELGYTVAEVLGTSILQYIHRDDAESAIERLGQLHSGVATPMIAVRLIAADGAEGWWEIISGVDRLPLAGGRVLTCREVTQRIDIERVAARWVDLLRHAFDVAQSALDLAPAEFLADLPTVCGRVAVALGVDFVYVDRLDQASGHLIKIAGFTGPDAPSGLDPGQRIEFAHLDGWVDRLRAFEPIVVSDASACGEPWAAQKRRMIGPEGGMMAMPLSAGGELLGVVGASMCRVPRTWSDDEVTFFRIVAETVAHVLDRERLDQALRASEARFRLLSETAADLVVLIDLEGRITYASPSSVHLLGLTPEQLIGSESSAFIHPDDRAGAYRQGDVVLERGWTTADMRLLRADGDYVWVTNSTSAVLDPATNQPIEFRSSIRDVSDRKHLEAKLEHQALHDPLTGLGNRILLQARLAEATASPCAASAPKEMSVLLLDLDGFKAVNDTYGHAAGDEVLREVAQRLRSISRPGDTLARTGGDEFVLLCPDADERDAVAIADRIVFVMSAPIRTAGFEVTLGASVGVAHVAGSAGRGGDNHVADWLLIEADHAMYQAKRAGKGRVAVAPVPAA